MAVEIVEDVRRGRAVLTCTTSDWAFGPVFDSREDAEGFLNYLAGPYRKVPKPPGALIAFYVDGTDPREYSDAGLATAYAAYQNSTTNERE